MHRIFLGATLACLVATALPARAQDAERCDEAKTQMETNECTAALYSDADRRLNEAYQAVLRRFTDEAADFDADRVDLLKTAQRAWIDYRDAACNSESATYEGGSIRPTITATCLARLTERRTHDLEQMAEGN